MRVKPKDRKSPTDRISLHGTFGAHVIVALLTVITFARAQEGAEPDELTQLRRRVAELEETLSAIVRGDVVIESDGLQPSPQAREMARLAERVRQLESRGTATEHDAERLDSLIESVVLLDDPAAGYSDSLSVLGRPWHENLEISGFAAFTFLATGDAGTHPEAGFTVKETTLFLEADAFADVSVFFELQINRLGQDDRVFLRTGEVYAHFRNVIGTPDENLLGIKVGRIDIPFGEEYLWQDAPDNPLISTSAPYPYGFDEGVLLYGELFGIGWIAALTDGTDDRSIEDDLDKALNLKLYGTPFDWLYLSGSFMRNGAASKSAFEFGGSHFQPVGASRASSLGASDNARIDSLLYQIDAKLTFGDTGYLSAFFGQAFTDDGDSAFDRDITWFFIEGLLNLTDDVYAVLRYSEIGTHRSSEGYHFDGKILADGNAAFGYDVRRFQRFAVGLGWRPVPNVLAKAEFGWDRFDLIDASPFDTDNDERWFGGLEIVVSF